MEALTLAPRRLSRDELIIGLVGSILAHVAVLAFAFALSLIHPRTTQQVPFYAVNLVTMEQLGPASPSSQAGTKGKGPAAARGEKAKQAASPKRLTSTAVVPVKRLQFEDTQSKVKSEIKKLEVAEIPDAPSAPEDATSVEKNLEKLITKPQRPPKPAARTSSDTDSAGVESDEPAALVEKPEPRSTQSSTDGGGRDASAAAGTERAGGGQVGLARRLYYTEVWNAIRSQWALPEFLKSQQLEAVLILTVSRNGTILALRFEKQSGNTLFDESVVRAVRKADPLPPFPEIYSPPREDIGVRFRPEDL